MLLRWFTLSYLLITPLAYHTVSYFVFLLVMISIFRCIGGVQLWQSISCGGQLWWLPHGRDIQSPKWWQSLRSTWTERSIQAAHTHIHTSIKLLLIQSCFVYKFIFMFWKFVLEVRSIHTYIHTYIHTTYINWIRIFLSTVGLPPLIKWIRFCPEVQNTSHISREHSGLCDVFASAGANHYNNPITTCILLQYMYVSMYV